MIPSYHAFFPNPSKHCLFLILPHPLQLGPLLLPLPFLCTLLNPPVQKIFFCSVICTRCMSVIFALRTLDVSFLRSGPVPCVFMTHQCCHGAALTAEKVLVERRREGRSEEERWRERRDERWIKDDIKRDVEKPALAPLMQRLWGKKHGHWRLGDLQLLHGS